MVLGAQAIGPGEGSKRIDVAAMALTTGITIDQLAEADARHAPSYSRTMGNVITAAGVARSKVDDHTVGIIPVEVRVMDGSITV